MNKDFGQVVFRRIINSLAYIYFKTYHDVNKKFAYIPPSGKVLDEKDLMNMIDASLDMWLSAGEFNDKFESKFAEYLGINYVLSTNSGSSANLLAVSALTSSKLGESRLRSGDEVITVATGFPTTINPIIQNGLIPVFVDTEIGTYNIDANQIEEAISDRTKAIIVSHTLGNPFNIKKVAEMCQKYSLWLIEDNCDALGARYNGKYTGTYGHISTFSFYPAHHITMGEGGAVAVNDEELYKIIMSLRDWGSDCWCPPGKENTCGKRFSYQLGRLPQGYDHKYTYSHIGYNLKVTDWQAALGLSQLDKLNYFIKQRKDNFNLLYNLLLPYRDYFIFPETLPEADPSWFGFLITVKDGCKFSKLDLVKYLENNNIGTRQLFAGNMLRQPAFTENNIMLRIRNSEILNSSELDESHYKMLPNTEKIMNSTFWTGVWPGLEEKHIEKIAEKIGDFVRDNS